MWPTTSLQRGQAGAGLLPDKVGTFLIFRLKVRQYIDLCWCLPGCPCTGQPPLQSPHTPWSGSWLLVMVTSWPPQLLGRQHGHIHEHSQGDTTPHNTIVNGILLLQILPNLKKCELHNILYTERLGPNTAENMI